MTNLLLMTCFRGIFNPPIFLAILTTIVRELGCQTKNGEPHQSYYHRISYFQVSGVLCSRVLAKETEQPEAIYLELPLCASYGSSPTRFAKPEHYTWLEDLA